MSKINNPKWDDLLFDVSKENKISIPEDVDDDSLEEQKRIRYKQDTHYRCIFSWWVIAVVSVWLSAILVIVFLQGAKILNLESSSFAMLLGTTTVNVLGLSYIVLKGMFPNPNEKK
jgi:hypothetical protein